MAIFKSPVDLSEEVLKKEKSFDETMEIIKNKQKRKKPYMTERPFSGKAFLETPRYYLEKSKNHRGLLPLIMPFFSALVDLSIFNRFDLNKKRYEAEDRASIEIIEGKVQSIAYLVVSLFFAFFNTALLFCYLAFFYIAIPFDIAFFGTAKVLSSDVNFSKYYKHYKAVMLANTIAFAFAVFLTYMRLNTLIADGVENFLFSGFPPLDIVSYLLLLAAAPFGALAYITGTVFLVVLVGIVFERIIEPGIKYINIPIWFSIF